MSFEEQISQIEHFGKAVINGAKPGTVYVPDFAISPEELNKIADFAHASDKQEMKIGFANCLLRILDKSLEIDEKRIAEFQAIVFDYAKQETNQSTLNGIMRAIDMLLTNSEGNWPQLFDFVLNDKEPSNQYLISHIITSANYIQDSDFIETNRAKLLKVIGDLLKSPTKDELPISRLLLIMTLKKPSIDDIQPYCEAIWETSLELAKGNALSSVCQAMHDFREIQGFDKYEAKCISQCIEKFGDANIEFEERIEIITPVIRLFPFLDDSALEKLLITIINYSNENPEEGIAIISKFDESNLDFVDDNSSILITLLVQQAIENENPCAGLLLYGPLADFVQVDEEFDKKVYKLIEDCLSNQPSEALCALFCISYTAMRLPVNMNIFGGVLRYIPYDGAIGEVAFNALNALFETTSYSQDVYVQHIIDSYKMFEGKTSLFAKLFIELIDKCEDPGLSIAQPIYEFAIPLISTDKGDDEKALALTLFSQLADLNKEFVEDRLEDMMGAGLQIIHSQNSGCVAAAANFFAQMAASFPSVVRDRVIDLIPELVKYITGEKQSDMANRNSIATAVCDIVANYDLRDEASEIASIATNDLSNENEDIQAEAVDMLYVLCKALLPDAAISLFETLCSKLETYTSKSTVNTLIKTIKALMKKYRVNKDLAKSTVQLVFEGKVPAIGQIEFLENSEESAVFELLKTFTKKYKKESLPFIKQVIGVLSFLDTDLIEAALEPIEAALRLSSADSEDKLIDIETVKDLSDSLLEMLQGDDNEPAKYVCSVINSIRLSYPDVIQDDNLIKILNDRLEMCDDEEDMDAVNAISCLILAIAAKSPCDPKLIAECCQILPLSPDYCDMEETLENAGAIAENPEIPDEVLKYVLFFMGKVVLMKKSQLEEYEIVGDILSKARQKISKIVKANPSLKEPLSQLLIKSKLSKVQVNSLLK